MTPIPDVLIVGAGAIGASCARALATSGAAVTLIECPPPAGEAWRASAGMVAAQVGAVADDSLFDLALAGRTFLRRNAELLRHTTGIDVGLCECGILDVARDETQAEAGKERVAWQRQQSRRADWLSAEDVADGWPWLGPCLGGFWSPEDGAVDPERLVAAFRADAVRLGAQVIVDTAVALDRDGDRLAGIIGERRRYPAAAVVIAAGAWSGRLTGLPRPLSIEPVRGQMLAFEWPAVLHAAIVYGAGCYLLRRGDEMLVGATVEHAGFDAQVTPQGLYDLHQRATTLYPALAAASPSRHWAGLRPWTPDGLPIIGPEPRLPGLWYATWHGRNGILLAGITGDVVARGMRGESVGAE
ncbi:MAG: glycine oxidase ThiO, partial [Gemmatimonadales bacterium]